MGAQSRKDQALTTMLPISLLASKLIQAFEGCKLQAYWDPTGKVWTIGFGHTGSVMKGDQISMAQAASLLEVDAAPLIDLVKDRPLIEAAALVSFGYNCGIGALRRVIRGEITITHEEFMAGDRGFGESSGGTTLPGLKARRQLEAALIEASRGSA